MNEESPLFWFDIPLKYSEHALIRCYERETPVLDYLPITARFIGKSSQHDMKLPVYKFEIDYRGKKLCILVNNLGFVATTYFSVPPVKIKSKKVKPEVKNYNKYPDLEFFDQLYEYA